jgi:hypothetical protein
MEASWRSAAAHAVDGTLRERADAERLERLARGLGDRAGRLRAKIPRWEVRPISTISTTVKSKKVSAACARRRGAARARPRRPLVKRAAVEANVAGPARKEPQERLS